MDSDREADGAESDDQIVVDQPDNHLNSVSPYHVYV